MKTVQDLQGAKIGPPQTICDILHGGWAIRILRTAVEISLFEALLDGPRDAQLVAKQLDMPLQGIALMLDSLVGLDLLERADYAGLGESLADGGTALYKLNEQSETYLLKDSPLFAGMYLKQHEELDKMWRSLTETVRSGKPVMEVNTDATAEEIFPRLAESIIPLNYAVASDVVQFLRIIDLAYTRPLKILDVACGSAIWSIPFAQDNRETKIDALDFPAVLDVARKTSERFGVSGNFNYLPGNWRDVKVQENHYDAVILGHILHSEGKELSQQLLAYCHACLREGGVLVIGEFMTNKEHTGPIMSLMFGLNMYLATTSGCVFSAHELKQMCLDAGFTDIIKHNSVRYSSQEESTVLLAIK
ncbi:MAG: methyltransferase domain-containing protein [Cyanobacteria bacterium SZAS LIN-2]|nr:methyltransferase domain-containing protein [Cyanobacteria bacterium SZAS LIN-2]